MTISWLFSFIGEELSDEEVADMIRVADEDGDGRINFDEFRTIMEFVKTGKMSSPMQSKKSGKSKEKCKPSGSGSSSKGSDGKKKK